MSLSIGRVQAICRTHGGQCAALGQRIYRGALGLAAHGGIEGDLLSRACQGAPWREGHEAWLDEVQAVVEAGDLGVSARGELGRTARCTGRRRGFRWGRSPGWRST